MATIRQRKAFDKVVETGGNVSKAMESAGYSVATAKTPQKLTESKGWEELMEQYFPDNLLAKRHKELLNKREKSIVEYSSEKAGGKNIYEVLDQPETQAVSKGLEMAYKLKGRLKEQQNNQVVNNQILVLVEKANKILPE